MLIVEPRFYVASVRRKSERAKMSAHRGARLGRAGL
jgi:hypothetical protein